MELEKLTPIVEEARELLDISHAIEHGDKFREELIAFIRKAGISARTPVAALKELETVKVMIGTFEVERRNIPLLHFCKLCNIYICIARVAKVPHG